MKKSFFVILSVFVVLFFLFQGVSFSDSPIVTAIDVVGNKDITKQYILSVVKLKVGEPLNEERLKESVKAIYNLGFFQTVDVDVEPYENGVKVIFTVVENPKVKEIKFKGNTVFTSKELRSVCFTSPGNVFNKEIFKRDLQRIREKYEKAGYVLVKITDVSIHDGVITVTILEPRVGEIIIQGNKKTKEKIIRRYLILKEGDIFNSKKLKMTLRKLYMLGYFEDVSVGFEPTPDPSIINLVLTVKEAKTGRLGFGVGYGTSTGWSGSIFYEDTNFQGMGRKIQVGAEFGGRKVYWIHYEDPWMDQKNLAWKIGIYRKFWEDLEYIKEDSSKVKYDQEKKGGYIGFGKKFGEQISAYITFDWHKTEITTKEGSFDPVFEREHLLSGTNFSTTLKLTRDTRDEMLSYPDGDVEMINVEKAFKALGGDWDYTKYWFEVRYYTPVRNLGDLFDTELGTEENPVIFATRLKAGFSSGYLPWAEQYFLGGFSGLRGYVDDRFSGGEMFLANFELRVPLEKNLTVALFYDLGNAWDKNKGESFSFKDLHEGRGIGIRVMTPIGYIRLDFATGEEETRTHFGIGELF